MAYLVFFIILLSCQQLLANYYIKNALEHIYVKRYFSKNRILEGETFEVVYEIENRKRLPLFNLSIIDYLPENLKTTLGNRYINQFHVNIGGYKKIIRKYTLLAVERDYVPVFSVNIRVSDPFGLYKNEKTFLSYDHIYIYPKPKELTVHSQEESIQMAKPIKKWILEDPLSFYSIRKYAPSDPFRKINWKKTAQFQELMVNEFEINANKRVHLYINVVGSNFNHLGVNGQYLEDILRYAAHILRSLIESGYETSLTANCSIKTDGRKPVYVRPGTGSTHLYRMYDMLSLMNYCNTIHDEFIIKRRQQVFTDGKIIVLSIANEFGKKLIKRFARFDMDAQLIEVVFDEEKQSI